MMRPHPSFHAWSTKRWISAKHTEETLMADSDLSFRLCLPVSLLLLAAEVMETLRSEIAGASQD
jgi:hypothetical protein